MRPKRTLRSFEKNGKEREERNVLLKRTASLPPPHWLAFKATLWSLPYLASTSPLVWVEALYTFYIVYVRVYKKGRQLFFSDNAHARITSIH